MAALTALLSARSTGGSKAAMPRVCPGCFQSTGMFNVSNGEVVKALVVNAGAAKGLIVNWKILDADGNTLSQSGPRTVVFNQAASFEFVPGRAAAGSRVLVRVALTAELIDKRGAREGEHSFIQTIQLFTAMSLDTEQ